MGLKRDEDGLFLTTCRVIGKKASFSPRSRADGLGSDRCFGRLSPKVTADRQPEELQLGISGKGNLDNGDNDSKA